MNRDADKSEIISSHPIKTKGGNNIISGKRFDEVKVKSILISRLEPFSLIFSPVCLKLLMKINTIKMKILIRFLF